jgi:hypothetical protein
MPVLNSPIKNSRQFSQPKIWYSTQITFHDKAKTNAYKILFIPSSNVDDVDDMTWTWPGDSRIRVVEQLSCNLCETIIADGSDDDDDGISS